MKCLSSNKLIIANIKMPLRRESSDMWNITFTTLPPAHASRNSRFFHNFNCLIFLTEFSNAGQRIGNTFNQGSSIDGVANISNHTHEPCLTHVLLGEALDDLVMLMLKERYLFEQLFNK